MTQAPKHPQAHARVEIARALANTIAGEVRFGLHDRMLYATDASIYQVEPIGVVVPSSVDDAVHAVRFCAENGIAVLPRGGGTSLAGQCTNHAVVIDFSANCRAVLSTDTASRTCRVEPGITVEELNAALRHTGLFFPPDPATARHANIGGCIGNNAAGARSVRYGRTSESLVGIDACLADGSRVTFDAGAAARDPAVRAITERIVDVVRRHEPLIRERFPKTIRRNAGYGLDMVLAQLDAGAGVDEINLAKLLAGSEGTLALTLGAELALAPIPTATGLAVVPFVSVEEAIETVAPILGTKPSAVELLDDMVIGLARRNAEYRRYADLLPSLDGASPEAVLYVEYASEQGSDGVEHTFDELRRVVAPRKVSTYTDADEMTQAWKLRKAGEPLLHGIPGDRKPLTFVEDNAVPVEHLPQFVREFRAIVERHGTRTAFFAHASVGVLHVRPLLDVRDPDDERRMYAIAQETARLAKSLGGVMSGEHGDGRVRSPLLEDFYGPELMSAFREIKHIFDPRNLLNPGNIVPTGETPLRIESISTRLRVKPDGQQVRVPEIDTCYDYDEQHGFPGAVELCNGAGVCRKKSGGTMCPSYMATLDERHSTRGRGNALRLAITGQLRLPAADGSPDWNDAETINTLDLCLSCKACKSECPSNVDIAKLKAEYTAQRYRATCAPRRVRRFADARRLNRLGSRVRWFANALASWTPTRRLVNRAIGVAPARTLPRFERPLAKQWGDGDKQNEPDSRPRVALFADCFCSYNEPGVALAARRVLESFGYRVELTANHGCCARPAISLGLLDQAKREADTLVTALAPLAEDDSLGAIIVLEPSCLSAMRDDWLALKLDADKPIREKIASKAMLLEEFLESRWDDHPTRPGPAQPPERVLLHAHCHQKALWGADTSASLLRRLLDDRLEVLDAGCCGMAGSFGMTPERFDLSMRVGELSLLPAARAADRAGHTLVAPGTSCRHQIHDGAGTRALHPAELLDQLFGRSSTMLPSES